MKDDHVILGVHVTNRMKKAVDVQAILTEYGCHISTRLGLHRADANVCAPAGLILLELVGDRAKCDELEAKLASIEGLDVQKMVFTHDA